ncbi:hypothetical protein D3C71_248560 [compost metagenome]
MKAMTTVIAGVCLAALLGGGWTLWRSTAMAHDPAAPGAGISVEVVAPVEPALPPQPILAVGELSNGYEHHPERLLPMEPLAVDGMALESAWIEPPPLPSTPLVVEPIESSATRVVRLEPGDYSFGFDRPLPEADTKTAPIDPTGAVADINGAR